MSIEIRRYGNRTWGRGYCYAVEVNGEDNMREHVVGHLASIRKDYKIILLRPNVNIGSPSGIVFVVPANHGQSLHDHNGYYEVLAQVKERLIASGISEFDAIGLSNVVMQLWNKYESHINASDYCFLIYK